MTHETGVGAGTCIHLHLPAAAPADVSPVAAPPPVLAPPVEPARLTVLVVEDELLVRQVTVDALTHAGYRVLEAGTAEAGLAILKAAGRVDALVTDIGLPGMDGRMLAERVRADWPDVRILFVSGYAPGHVFGSPGALAGTDLLPKPFTPRELVGRVERLLQA